MSLVKQKIKSSILIASIALILFSIFIINDYSQLILVEKINFFNKALIIFASTIFLFSIISKYVIYFDFSDLLILLFSANYYLLYDFDKALAPEHLLFFTALLVLYFLLRFAYGIYPDLRHYTTIIIVATGAIISAWALAQLYGFLPSLHNLFKTTASFYNPGPLGGFIAVSMPMALSCGISNKNKYNFYLSVSAFVLGILVLPASMSRTAWLACILSCFLVIVLKTSILCKLRIFYQKRRHLSFIIIGFLLFIILSVSIFIFNVKRDSAQGRVFMSKITSKAILNNSLMGNGVGSFPALYANAQIEYFKSGKARDNEKIIAGTPHAAFNEYLQLILEQGIQGFLLFICLIAYSTYKAFQNRQIAILSGVISLLIFAAFSYPFSLPSFLILFVALLASVGNKQGSKFSFVFAKKHINFSFALLLLVSAFIIFAKNNVYYNAHITLTQIDDSYIMKNYRQAEQEYSKLYNNLCHNQKYIFEYAKMNLELKKHKESNIFITRGLQISNDPMFYNMAARNYIALKRYKQAEQCLQISINLVPSRIYPHYLFVKLYSNPNFKQPDKLQKHAKIVLHTKAKIYSPAIIQMRDEVTNILNKKLK